VGDGIFTEDALWEIHHRMVEELRQNGITVSGTYYCLHGKDEGCKCRKPETGLFEQAVKDFQFDPAKTFFVGDKVSDIEAGKRFGLRTIFVRTGHGKTNETLLKGDLVPDFIADDIGEAAGLIES
jgi:histidinol-phosphate phosphatase family protein